MDWNHFLDKLIQEMPEIMRRQRLRSLLFRAAWIACANLMLLSVALGQITGPDRADPGTPVVVQSATNARYAAWALVPEGKVYADSNGKTLCWTAPCSATKQAFILVTSDQGPVGFQVVDILGQRAYFIKGPADAQVFSHTVTVGDGPEPKPDPQPDPDPKPDPQPDPQPTPAKDLRAYVVYEKHLTDVPYTTVINSLDVREAFRDKWTPIDKDVVNKLDAVPPDLKPYLDKAASHVLPWLMLANEKEVIIWEGALPATVKEAVDLAKKFGPQQKAPIPDGAKIEVKREPISLLCVYDGSEASVRQLPVMESLINAGYNVVFCNANKPSNTEALQRFKIEVFPYFIIGVGHEALETWSGELTVDQLSKWYWNIHDGKQTSGPTRATIQDMLTEADKPYLVTSSRSSCWMMNCPFHQVQFIEVMANGQKVPAFEPPKPKGHWERGDCSTGRCPK